MRFLLPAFLAAYITAAGLAWPQSTREQPKSDEPTVAEVEIVPATAEAEIGKELTFQAVAKDESGKTLDLRPSSWFSAPWDLVGVEQDGRAIFHGPGEVRVGAVIGGKTGLARVTVKPPRVKRIEIAPGASPLIVGGDTKLSAAAFTARDDPRDGVVFTWTAESPQIATVDEAGLVTALAPGRASFRVTAEAVSAAVSLDVVENKVARLTIEPRVAHARTGDVIRFAAQAKDQKGNAVPNPVVRWSVSGPAAFMETDGGFFAERPGTYSVLAASGKEVSVASVVVTERNVEREIEVVGRVPVSDFQMAEQWIFGKYAYLSSIADKVQVYDISNPGEPQLLDTVTVDARLINDVSLSPDGRLGVLTREGASNRKNGIVLLDTSDPGHPKVLSEFTETVTGGVHSAFLDGHHIYLTDDATGSMRVIDVEDPKSPRQVARWEVENPKARTIVRTGPEGEDVSSSGRYLHDVYVKDGLAYLAYWRDGLVILDVGKGLKGGSPERPQRVGQLRFDYHRLYGDGWLAGAHAVFRYQNYVFIGDEVFPARVDIRDKKRIAVRGIVFVIDVSDIEKPRLVAEYNVPEAGAHNMWVVDDVLYMGYYSGGGRVLDVSGELRGDLYRQGREIARLWTGDPQGFRPNLPFTWGAQPQAGLIYFNDINSGLWIVKLGKPKNKGALPAPGY